MQKKKKIKMLRVALLVVGVIVVYTGYGKAHAKSVLSEEEMADTVGGGNCLCWTVAEYCSDVCNYDVYEWSSWYCDDETAGGGMRRCTVLE
jgi:hypothetical protein